MLSAGKISCCILIDINPEFWSRPTWQKQILVGVLVTKIYNKKSNKNFFIQLFYAWLHLTNNNIPSPYL